MNYPFPGKVDGDPGIGLMFLRRGRRRPLDRVVRRVVGKMSWRPGLVDVCRFVCLSAVFWSNFRRMSLVVSSPGHFGGLGG